MRWWRARRMWRRQCRTDQSPQAKFPLCQNAGVSCASAQNVPNGVNTTLTFDTNRYDTNGIHTNAGSRLTCNTAGVYHIFANVAIGNSSAGSQRNLILVVNGSVIIGYTKGPANTSGQQFLNVSVDYYLNENDHVEVQVAQDSGTTMTVLPSDTQNDQEECEFGMSYVP